MAADAQPQATAADVPLPATVVGIPLQASTAADPRTAVDPHTVAVDRMAVVVADMGGNIALDFFPA